MVSSFGLERGGNTQRDFREGLRRTDEHELSADFEEHANSPAFYDGLSLNTSEWRGFSLKVSLFMA